MAQNLGTKVDVGVGVIRIIAGILVIIQLPAAHQYHETTVDELANYDLAYAPPFNTTWDPVLTAAKVLGGRF